VAIHRKVIATIAFYGEYRIVDAIEWPSFFIDCIPCRRQFCIQKQSFTCSTMRPLRQTGGIRSRHLTKGGHATLEVDGDESPEIWSILDTATIVRDCHLCEVCVRQFCASQAGLRGSRQLASMYAAECSPQIAVSCVGREHRRAQAGRVSIKR
jgi:hypothetical protein